MAEILKITTPYVNKNSATAPNKPIADPTTNPFTLQDVKTIARPATQEEILQQNNGMIEKENSSNVLTGLLKDPSATVNFLKNIMILQELVKLLPAKNTTMTQEIEQLFNALLVRPEEIATEMMRQENTSTTFKGELFNFLRGLLGENNAPEIRASVANLLKAINNQLSSQDALRAVSNSLKYLAESLAPSKGLSEKLAQLSARFRQADAALSFQQLKKETLSILKDVEESLLFSPKLAKVDAITVYNLSRFNMSTEFFQESISNLYLMLSGKERLEFSEIMSRFRSGLGNSDPAQESKIMEVLTKIIGMQASDKDISAVTAEKIEKIIYSLLSSPCHFTPLLHFVVPVEFEFLKAFAEIWINPNGKEDRRDRDSEQTKDCIHMLLVFDIEGIGQFEAEIYAIGQKLELNLLCPAGYSDLFAKEAKRFERCIAQSPYQLENIRIDKLERQRSLMDVFKSLPYKRTGVNVKV